MKVYRQGDVLLIEQKLPKESKKIDPSSRGYVLAEGEATGHAHVIKTGHDVSMFEKDNERYLHITDNVDLVHDEHGTVIIDPGDYRIVHQVEYTPKEIRRVAD